MLSQLQKQISAKMKAKEDASALVAEREAALAQKAPLEKAEADAQVALDLALFKIGNIVHESVPVSNDEVCDPITQFSLTFFLSL